jgi:hypothetical protein
LLLLSLVFQTWEEVVATREDVVGADEREEDDSEAVQK